MKKTIIVLMIAVVVVLLLISGCKMKEEIVDMDQFSSFQYENYTCMFPPVLQAVYHHDGVQEAIAPNDPRLIRLLNALAYSYNEGYNSWIQGWLEYPQIAELEQQDIPMLEVYFSPAEPGGTFTAINDAEHMLLCANSYLLYATPEDPEEWTHTGSIAAFAGQTYPFAKQIIAVLNGTGNTEQAWEWGEDTWLNLLALSGF